MSRKEAPLGLHAEQLLASMLTGTAKLSDCYATFWQYSVMNQLLAYCQLKDRGLALSPISTFKHWQSLGRRVKKGSKALILSMPQTCKRKPKDSTAEQQLNPSTLEVEYFTRFIYVPRWFALSQTEGQPYIAPDLPDWSFDRALQTLAITEAPFEEMDGNTQGYAKPASRTIHISPLADHPELTRVHEIAHVLLHGDDPATVSQTGEPRPDRSVRELEAECTAVLVCDALHLASEESIQRSRGYIQHWYRDHTTIPDVPARRIFKTANDILKAGQHQPTA